MTDQFIGRALSERKDAAFYSMSSQLASQFPDRFVLETEESSFNVLRYAHAGLCEVRPSAGSQLTHGYVPEHETYWVDAYNAWFDVLCQGEEFQLITIGLQGAHCRDDRHYLVAENELSARRFFLQVCAWNSEVRGEVLVFNAGWSKDADLYEAIQNATLDNLILEGSLKEQIAGDFRSFFEAKDTYKRYGIPWKRGVLFLGPPGNGKTHMIKGLVNRLGVPCLYVKSFKHPYSTDHEMMRQVFQRARNTAPCLLVLEDLDALLDDENRSFFLNEMDGFASNEGMMVVATTNHPERLDPAILERPSRFDRKYLFNLPEVECRFEYLRMCNGSLEPDLQLSEEELKSLADLTDGFSFAYLKELFLSAMMNWIEQPGASRMLQIISGQIEVLRQQMATEPAEPTAESSNPYAMQMRYMERWKKKRR
jgi:hypothetical protein